MAIKSDGTLDKRSRITDYYVECPRCNWRTIYVTLKDDRVVFFGISEEDMITLIHTPEQDREQKMMDMKLDEFIIPHILSGDFDLYSNHFYPNR